MSDELRAELAGRVRSRPLRIAFLVESTEHAGLVLDGIFADCYSRWGGRFSLIAPCADGQIVAEYWQWLEAFDPDIVYAYANLAAERVLEIHERLVPSDYILHRLDNEPRLNLNGFRPQYPPALSSLSTVFRLARHSPLAGGPKIKIIDSWYTEKPSRFLTDNFGTYQGSAATGMYPNDARVAAGLMTIVSDDHYEKREFGVPRDLDRVASEEMAFLEFVGKRVTSLSMLSSLYATRLEIRDYRWSDAFNLVIGDSFEDRLMFWNARLLIPAWLDNDLCCFRMTLDQLKDEDMLNLLVQLLNTRNHVNGGGGGQSQLRIRSASHTIDELNEVLERLRAAKAWSAHGPAAVIVGGHVIPSEDSLKRAREVAEFSDGFRSGERHAFRWKSPVAYPPAKEPEHLRDAPTGQVFTLGLWALDLSFEYERDKPRLAQDNVWMLPKRWRMAGAFVTKFITKGFAQNNPSPMCRTSRNGNLTLFAGFNRELESVTVPTIDQAFRSAMCLDSAARRVGPGDPPWPQKKAAWMKASNESPHLIGILGMTGGLAGAKSLLLHPFLQDVFASLGGAPNLADADVKATANALAKRAKGRPIFDLQQEGERETLAALIVKAAQSIKAPRMHVSLDYLRDCWKAHRERYWAEHPLPRLDVEQDEVDWDGMEQQAIDDRLAEMRSRLMLFQGYPWSCDTCRHRNWTDYQALSPALVCDVCRTEKELPVGIPWYFRPNEFLIESLRSRSVLSLVWLLSALCDRANSSFMYLGPTCFGYSPDSRNPDVEADLLAVVDGESILCEVKSAWRSLRAAHIEDFVHLAKRLRPDRAILAVMEIGVRLEEEMRTAETALRVDGIQFELLTLENYSVEDDPYLLGR
ncbi:hypothetical protein V9L13_06390 [Pseudomonas sp. RSB 5.4]|uniref:hypothetical protein n=1 Tax=Pseudomonas sp. RSB 5.4 TaxID=3127459 RepID=UPI0030CB2760